MAVRPRKVFEIGMPKTGTTSLGRCFQILGFRNKGYTPDIHREVVQEGRLERALRVIEQFDAFHDGPWHNMDPQILDRRFPGSRFVILERNDEDWYESMVYQYTVRTRRDWFKLRSKKEWQAYKRLRYDLIRVYFANRPGDLLVMNIADGLDRWEPLCRFLRVPVPDVPFPHLNRRSWWARKGG